MGPEAQLGGPIALLKDGDMITLDAIAGTLTCNVSAAEFAIRKKSWKPREKGGVWPVRRHDSCRVAVDAVKA